jgi:hypothetical protein
MMAVQEPMTHFYAREHSARLDRLILPARMYEPFTRQLFRETDPLLQVDTAGSRPWSSDEAIGTHGDVDDELALSERSWYSEKDTIGRLATRLGQLILRAHRFDGSRALFVIVRRMIDLRAHQIALHRHSDVLIARLIRGAAFIPYRYTPKSSARRIQRKSKRIPCSLRSEPASIVIRGIAVNCVHVHRGIASHSLWGELDDQLRTLDSVIGGTVFPRLMRSWSAPRKIGIDNPRFDLCHTGYGVSVMEDFCPFRN